MNIKVIGIGGVGDAVLRTLALYLNSLKTPNRLVLIDGDAYEDRNSERQGFDRIGNKAEVKAERLLRDFPQMPVKAFSEYVTPESIEYLTEEGDIVFLCVDNHKTRSFVSEYCRDLDNITLISGGNDFSDGNIQVYARRDGRDLTLPLGNKYHPEISFPEDRSPHEIGCHEVVASKPQLVFTNNLIAALMLNAFYSCCAGEFPYDEVYGDILSNNCRAVKRS